MKKRTKSKRMWAVIAAVTLIMVIGISGMALAAEENLLQNPGFETGSDEGWTITDNEMQSVGEKPDPYTGTYSLDTWQSKPDGITTIEQSAANCKAGKYTLSVWIKGGGIQNGNKAGLQLFENDTLKDEVEFANDEIAEYKEFKIENEDIAEGSTIKVVIYTKNAADGLWLHIDDVSLTTASSNDPVAEENTQISNPKTGDVGMVSYAVIAIIGAVGLAYGGKKVIGSR